MGGHEGVGTGASAVQPTSSGKVDSPSRGAIAREELITADAKTTTAVVPIANVVARLIEPFISLCHCRVESKRRRIPHYENDYCCIKQSDEPLVLSARFARHSTRGRLFC